MSALRVSRHLTSLFLSLGLFLATLIGGPVVRAVLLPTQQAAAATQMATAKQKATKGRITVTLRGTGSYTVKGKDFRKSASRSKTFLVAPGRYRIKAKGAKVKPAKVKVHAGKTVKVRVTFPAPRPGPTPTPAPTPTPTPTPEPKINPNTITAGWVHTCGIDTTGNAWCWGKDNGGILGDGDDDAATEYTPVAVEGSHTFTALTAGWDQTCGLDTDGKAWCWGNDFMGQVGDGDASQTAKYAPAAVADNHTFTSVSAGADHVCAIDTAGKAWCWGADGYGQVGDGDASQTAKYAPVAVAGNHTFTSVRAGTQHTCAIDADGAAWCWGWDEYGQVGDGTTNHAYVYAPVAVLGGHSFSGLAAGDYHTCGIDTTGKAWCWGWDGNGQLGDGNDDQATETAPVAVADNHTFDHLTAGLNQSCGIDATGKAWCWGWDGDGEVGDGTANQANVYAPVAVADDHTFTAVTAGTSHTCAVDTSGGAWCWGLDTSGQLGDGNDDQANETAPVSVAGGHTFATTY